jgi:hypothetical protein
MNYNWRRTFVLAMTSFLLVAESGEARTPRSSDGVPARLVVYRIPTTGKFVIVQLYVDDVVVGGIPYGGTYEGFLKPGRRVLSALATPDPQWWERPPTVVQVRSGQTYAFEVKGNGQGNLVLRPIRLRSS